MFKFKEFLREAELGLKRNHIYKVYGKFKFIGGSSFPFILCNPNEYTKKYGCDSDSITLDADALNRKDKGKVIDFDGRYGCFSFKVAIAGSLVLIGPPDQSCR